MHVYTYTPVYLYMEGPGQLVAALGSHAFILCVVEGVEG